MTSPPNPDSLIQRCLSGDHAAWSAIVDQYAGLVYAIARAHSFDPAACDDVAQDVFSKLWKSLGQIRTEEALPGWISTTTKRQCWRVQSIERRHQQPPSGAEGAAAPTEDQLSTLESAARVRRALDELGGQCEKLLRALFFTHRDAEYAVVSELLEIPVGSIGPTRQRCLAKLARILDPEAY